MTVYRLAVLRRAAIAIGAIPALAAYVYVLGHYVA